MRPGLASAAGTEILFIPLPFHVVIGKRMSVPSDPSTVMSGACVCARVCLCVCVCARACVRESVSMYVYDMIYI
jgi:hypothetical protein